jgi:hypothetical protein
MPRPIYRMSCDELMSRESGGVTPYLKQRGNSKSPKTTIVSKPIYIYQGRDAEPFEDV